MQNFARILLLRFYRRLNYHYRRIYLAGALAGLVEDIDRGNARSYLFCIRNRRHRRDNTPRRRSCCYE